MTKQATARWNHGEAIICLTALDLVLRWGGDVGGGSPGVGVTVKQSQGCPSVKPTVDSMMYFGRARTSS